LRRTLVNQLALTEIFPIEGRYSVDSPAIKLIVTHDMHEAAHADALQRIGADIPVVGHVHLQLDSHTPPMRQAFKSTIGRTSLAIFPANFLKEQIQEQFPELEKCIVVRNGVDASRFRPTTHEERRAFKRSQGITEDCLLVANIGALSVAKGSQALAVFAELLKGTRVHLAQEFQPPRRGPGATDESMRQRALAQRIKRAAPDNVHLLPCEDSFADRAIRYCDVLIHFSLGEVAPLTVIEGWMSGLRVIATASTPFYREVEMLEFALQVLTTRLTLRASQADLSNRELNTGTAEDLAYEAMQKLAEMFPPDDTLRRRIAEAARAEGFSATHMISRCSTIYQSVAQRVGVPSQMVGP
jgi:glycosyltransferase involved in cell wall biosynthesis